MTSTWKNASEALLKVKFLYAPIPSCFPWKMLVYVAEIPVWNTWVHLCHISFRLFSDKIIFLEVIVVYEEAVPIPNNSSTECKALPFALCLKLYNPL